MQRHRLIDSAGAKTPSAAMDAVGDEGGAKSVRRISACLSTDPARRAETAHRVDARNLCRRNRQTSAGGRRVSLAEFFGAARRRAHLRRPWPGGVFPEF